MNQKAVVLGEARLIAFGGFSLILVKAARSI